MLNKQIKYGMQLLKQNCFSEAKKLKLTLLEKHPKVSAAQYFSAEVSLAEGNYSEALKHLNNAIETETKQSFLYLKKAEVLLNLKKRTTARESAKKAAVLDPTNPKTINSVASIYSLCDDHTGAERYWLQAAKLNSQDILCLFNLARNQFFLGKMKNAEEYLNNILEIKQFYGPAIHLRSQLKTHTLSSNHIRQLKSITKQSNLSWNDSMHSQYALAKELEDTGNFSESFQALQTGSKLRRAHLQFDIKKEVQNMHDMIKFITADALKKSSSGDNDPSPIFIVGMPRTGTTLVERILCNSNKVKSAGETSDFNMAMATDVSKIHAECPSLSGFLAALQIDFASLGKNYISTVRESIGQSTYFVDKLPFNYLYCGLIKQALPNAKIIHMVRDPMDTCFAIYKTLFHQAYFFSYDLDELGEYYIAYRQLMEHWKHTIPDILDVRYEDLVSTPNKEAQRIYDHCGLKFEDKSLAIQNLKTPSSTASAAQIRQPIYTSSINKWLCFEAQLSTLKEKLEKSSYLQ